MRLFLHLVCNSGTNWWDFQLEHRTLYHIHVASISDHLVMELSILLQFLSISKRSEEK